MGFILKTFENSINDNDEVILIDFLRNILTGVNNSLGGLNNFRVIHNKDTNLFEIRSEVNLNIKPPNDPSIINTFGVVKGGGSFVREIDFYSELTDKFATMVSAGAQADGNISQTNSTAFSIYNKGLKDRIIVETVDTTKADTNESKIEDLFTDDVIKCFEAIYINKKFSSSNISILQNINSQYCKLVSGKLTQLNKAKAPFFLPFNLGVTIDGLSGMKIYQSFKVDGNVLPLTYNSKDIQLIITNLSHDISPNGWLTKIETIAGPVFEILSSLTPGTYSESGRIETSATNPELANNTERITPAETENNIVIAKQYFEQRGFSPVQVSAIIGALLQESRLNPNIKNNIGAYGIAQWLGDRRKNLLAKPNSSNLRTQLDYIIEEFNSTERISGSRLKKATTLEEAIAAMAGYERYGGIKGQSPTFEDVLRAPETGNRIGFAKNIFNRYQTIGSTKSNPFNSPQMEIPIG